MAFSAINTPFFEIPYDIDESNQYEFPSQLKRSTNDWMFHYGKYPLFCAAILDDEQSIDRRLITERHVAMRYIGPHLTQRLLVHQIERVITQLSRIPRLSYEKKPSEIHVWLDGDEFTLKFFVCDGSGFFHILLHKPVLYEDFYEQDLYTPNINKLILCIRSLLQDNDFVSDLPEITREQWFRHGHMTKIPHIEIEDVVPEWLEDDVADWNFPNIEAEAAPVLLGDILETM